MKQTRSALKKHACVLALLLLVTACGGDDYQNYTDVQFQPMPEGIARDRLILTIDKALGNDFARKLFHPQAQQTINSAQIQLDKSPEPELIMHIQSPSTCMNDKDCLYAIFTPTPAEESGYRLLMVTYGHGFKLSNAAFDRYRDFAILNGHNIEYWKFVTDYYGDHYDVLNSEPIRAE